MSEFSWGDQTRVDIHMHRSTCLVSSTGPEQRQQAVGEDRGTLLSPHARDVYISSTEQSLGFSESRQLPYALRPKVPVATKLDRLENDGILSKGRLEWVGHARRCGSQEGRLRSPLRRLQGQPQQPADSRQYPLPRVNDVFVSLAGRQWFTKIDLRQAYLQLEMEDESKEYFVLNTHKGFWFLPSDPPSFQNRLSTSHLAARNGSATARDSGHPLHPRQHRDYWNRRWTPPPQRQSSLPVTGRRWTSSQPPEVLLLAAQDRLLRPRSQRGWSPQNASKKPTQSDKRLFQRSSASYAASWEWSTTMPASCQISRQRSIPWTHCFRKEKLGNGLPPATKPSTKSKGRSPRTLCSPILTKPCLCASPAMPRRTASAQWCRTCFRTAPNSRSPSHRERCRLRSENTCKSTKKPSPLSGLCLSFTRICMVVILCLLQTINRSMLSSTLRRTYLRDCRSSATVCPVPRRTQVQHRIPEHARAR